jgi:hypothetical protein
MNSKPSTAAPATAETQDALKILQGVSHVYETMKDLRRRAARAAHDEGATYQELSDAIGINRSSAYNLIKRDAA